MLKVSVVVFFVLIGEAILTVGMSCHSCGSECAAACGTRRFRSCCMNYLRKKRGPDDVKLWSPSNAVKTSTENFLKSKIPAFIIEGVPESWLSLPSNEFETYHPEDTLENRLQTVYGA